MEMFLNRALISLNTSPIFNWSIRNRPALWSTKVPAVDKIKERRLIIMVPIGFIATMMTLIADAVEEKEFNIIPMFQEPTVHNEPEFGVLFNASVGLELLESMDQSSKGKLIFSIQFCFKTKRSEEWLQLQEIGLLRRFRHKPVKIIKVKIVSCLTDSSTLCFKTTSEEVDLSSRLVVTKELEEDDVLLHLISKRANIPGLITASLKSLKRELYAT